MSRYVIMANGNGTRWKGYLGTPKHLLTIDGETLLTRIVRQIREREPGAEVYVSAENPQYETPGAIRHAPQRKEIELDRFVPELLCDGVCFLYGDTFYTDDAMDTIMAGMDESMQFFATQRSIVAVKTEDADLMSKHLENVRTQYTSGRITRCKGWQVYRSYKGQPLDGLGAADEGLILIEDETGDFNRPEDLQRFAAARTQDGHEEAQMSLATSPSSPNLDERHDYAR
ncbi:MAG: NTP transferase domain-containing protein [Ancrocorticia sp.]|uniref:NTP transferase domain-containing protein n=1 Tax=Ancrocorticia sp. TaxID=2593684 RepID=UPI003F8F53B7